MPIPPNAVANRRRIVGATINACCLVALSLSAGSPRSARADGAQDNLPANVRPIPPPGIVVPDSDRSALEAGIAELGKEIAALRTELQTKPALLTLLPDVQIYYNAVRYALTYNEFFNVREIGTAKELLKQGMERAAQLRAGNAPWTTQTGLVARGYLSKIDGSVQPYGLVVPDSYRPGTAVQHRLDLWFHGRGETLSEVNFIADRQRNRGEFTPPNAFVLHPYGRYCNANKLAGEIDTFEALEHAKRHYAIDPNRIVARGFSMGGAACWQFAVHYADQWVAAAPGAGFSETPDFLKVFQNEKVAPTWYERKLWHLYDCTDYAVNLFNLPTVAYSGEKDGQKQAADIMAKALQQEGVELTHILGVNAGHFYTPAARAEINRRIDSIAALGRNQVPSRIRFTTWTLRYPKHHWLQLDGLERHWERARVDADLLDAQHIRLTAKNVSALTLSFPPGHCPLDVTRKPTVTLDGQRLAVAAPPSDRSWTAHFRKTDRRWQVVASSDDGTLRKRPGLQGPVDDAFLDSFLMATPTGTPMNATVGAWVASEQQHAIKHWRQQYRGEARVKTDAEVTEADIAEHNLILWGDPSSNRLLARIADRLPIRWTAQGVQVGTKTFSADQHAPILIFPNPLNPKRYVVLNSGFTFREYDYLNNARQVPKLPDFAVVNLLEKPNARYPGKIVLAGFFDEAWALPATIPPPDALVK